MDILRSLVLWGYVGTLACFSLFGLYKFILLVLYIKNKRNQPVPSGHFQSLPRVTIQLPVYKEMYVVERLIEAACEMDYPQHLLEIQVLDDSTDETCDIAKRVVADYRSKGMNIVYLHRTKRTDYKAGALAEGLSKATGEFVAIFDADFVPSKDFLQKTIHFFINPKVGMVQARWGFINQKQSLLTRIQTVFLDGHFIVEHTSRHLSGRFFNFNGTAGVWRKDAIMTAGGWNGDTLTEDLDLSYRAQLRGWQFIYLKDLVVPSELPLEIGAFKGQQHRWVKGMTQVGLKLLPEIWKSNISLLKKLDSSFHLLSNTGYVTTTLMALLVVPTLLLFERFFRNWVLLSVLYLFATNFLAVFLYFAYAEKEAGPWRWSKIRDVLMLMVVGIGLSINGTKAIIEALMGKRTSFVRTPKYSASGKQNEKWYLRKYKAKTDNTFLVEVIMAVYFLWCAYLVFLSGNPYFVLPLCFFGPGYFYLAYQSIRSKFLIQKSAATAQ